MTRREKLLRLCEFDENRVYLGAFVKSYQTGHLDGQYSENKKLLPILTALIDESERLRSALEKCIARLEFIESKSCGEHEKLSGVGWWESGPTLTTARQALAASPLDALLQGEK